MNANSADFDGDGKKDFLFQNKSSGILNVWFMDGSSFRYSAPITYNGSPLSVAGTGWKLVSTGFFDPTYTNNLCVLWQHETQPALAVWTLTGTNQTVFLRSFLMPQTVASGWKAVASGDFDGNSYTDIALENINDGQKAVWLMAYTNLNSGAVIGNPGTGWKITGAGDFGSSVNTTSVCVGHQSFVAYRVLGRC